jgi:hypothetical protein
MCYMTKDHKWKYQKFDTIHKKRIFVCEKCGKESKSSLNLDLKIILKRRKVDNEHVVFSKVS